MHVGDFNVKNVNSEESLSWVKILDDVQINIFDIRLMDLGKYCWWSCLWVDGHLTDINLWSSQQP